MGLLMLLGLIVMYAIGPQRAHVLNMAYATDFYSSTYFFTKQAISLAMAVAVFIVMAKLPYSYIVTHAKTIFMVGIGSCVVLALASFAHLGIAQCSLGACRWFDLGPFGSVQPAEVLKLGLVLFVAGFLSYRIRMGLVNDWYKTLIPLGAIMAVVVFFIIGLQKDMGTGIAMIGIVASMLVVAGVKLRVGLMLVGISVLAGILLILIAPHRLDRISTFLAGDTIEDSAASYHIAHAKIAIGSGGLLGVGIGNSVQATGYLPEAINDSVFAIMGETFGFVGLIVVLILFTALLMRLLLAADRLNGVTERLMVAGVFGWLASHVVLNIAAMTGVFPLTGITLPLLSFGGTSIVFIAGALGLAFQLSAYTTHATEQGGGHEDSRRRRGVGRTRYASRRSNN
ncbi:FtsW/RodA/SpoVE family cell cycle protein [Candidatus Saccharibacteria bacterium]|nr:FtsW/RodA/SpoVE family cell cycle protein [Candidatus Saccharibacteria bacterium]